MASVLTAWALVVAAFDWRRRRVPNPASILVAIPAVVAPIFGLLGADVKDGLAGFAFGAVILLPGYFGRRVGAGDVKLTVVLGLLLSIRSMLVAGAAKISSRQKRDPHYRLPGAVALIVGFLWSLWYGRVMGALGV
ncbi:MAG: Peptidase prepilin type [Nevskia sp.]|nr:Peptidase prepilin type [Nevskia sp.]